MRVVFVPLLFAVAVASAGCNSVLGIDDHPLAAQGTGSAGSDGGVDSGVDSGVDMDTGTHSDAGVHADAAPKDGSGPIGDAPIESGEAGSPGGPVNALSCANDAGACVVGGIVSGGQVAGDAGALSPDGGAAAVFDDGFELGETLCSGTTCVTGAITP